MGKRGRPDGSKDIAPMIRGAFIRACKVNEQRGKGLTGLIADSLVRDPINTIKAMASFNPRQMQMDMNVKVEVSEIIALAQQRQAKNITPEPEAIEADCQTLGNIDQQSASDKAGTRVTVPRQVEPGTGGG